MAATTRSGLAALALATFALGGCTIPGRDDEETPKTVTFDTPAVNDPATPAGVERAFRRGEQSFLDHDFATACAGFTPDYMKKAYGITPERCVDRLTVLRDQLTKESLEPAPRQLEATVKGNRGTLKISTKAKRNSESVDQTITYNYILEDGRWKAVGVSSQTGGSSSQ